MGNENKRSEFDQQNWQILSVVGTKTVLKNRLTHSLLDLYECDENSQTMLSKKARDLYQWRKNIPISEHIPLLYHYEVETPLIGSAQHQKVFTEHLTRFSDLLPISKQESFLILEQIITVLPLLYKQFGLFHANIYTIAVNDSGVTKVWINENLAKNSVQTDDIIKKPSQNLQLTIVNNLVRMVKTKVYNGQIKPQYPFSLNFLGALKFIKETRQKYAEYNVSQVFFDRNEFNQKYMNKKIEQVIIQNQVPNINPMKQQSAQPIPYVPINTPYNYQHHYLTPNFQKQNNQPIHFYTPPANHMVYSPFERNIRTNIAHNISHNPPFAPMSLQNRQLWQNNATSIQPMFKKQKIQQSYYLSSPQIPQNNRTNSPMKDNKHVSPSKALKNTNGQPQLQNIFPRRQQAMMPNTSDRERQNRPTSLSPSKKQPIKEQAKAPQTDRQKPAWVRPISSNNRTMTKKELSRIIEEQQGRFDSIYFKNLQKKSIPADSQQGFNVQMVQSIYVKTNQTEEGG